MGSLSWSVSKKAEPKSASLTVEKLAETRMLSGLISADVMYVKQSVRKVFLVNVDTKREIYTQR